MNKKIMSTWRFYFTAALLFLGAACLFWRMLDLNILQRKFLLQQSNARIIRVVTMPAFRGMITDRFLQPLAISAQVDSLWINPQLFQPSNSQLVALSRVLRIPINDIQSKTARGAGKEFLYL